MNPRTPVAAAIVCAAAGVAAAQPPTGSVIDVRFCPSGQVRAYAFDSQRGLQSLLLQNAAIINRGTAPPTIASISIELVRAGAVVDERRLTGPLLERMADAGRELQRSGAMQLFAFQFCGTDMIPAGSRMSGPVLGSGEVLLVPQQAFAYSGERDGLRVQVQARSEGRYVEVSAALPIRSGFATHTYRFPLRGVWYVAAGPSFHTAHRWAVMEEFALDILNVGESGLTHRLPGTQFEEYFAYGADVLAAADGRVVGVANDEPEDPAAMRQPAESEAAYLAPPAAGPGCPHREGHPRGDRKFRDDRSRRRRVLRVAAFETWQRSRPRGRSGPRRTGDRPDRFIGEFHRASSALSGLRQTRASDVRRHSCQLHRRDRTARRRPASDSKRRRRRGALTRRGTQDAAPAAVSARIKGAAMAVQRIPDEKEATASAEAENTAEASETTSTENEQKKEQIEYDELLDDRFQATDN